ncbi:hypothetical protein VDGL01_04094, partial [Verticillium dahliae]
SPHTIPLSCELQALLQETPTTAGTLPCVTIPKTTQTSSLTIVSSKATSVDETETAHHRVTVIIYHCGNTQRKAHCPTLTASRSFKAGDIRRT